MKQLLLLLLAGSLTACVSPTKIPPIATSSKDDVFAWHDLASTRSFEDVQSFYGSLFEWDFVQIDSAYSVIIDPTGQPVGAVIHTAKTNPQQKSSVWISSIQVKDVVGTVQTIEDTGGKILKAPVLVPDRGIIALFEDPQGAIVQLVETYLADQTALNSPWVWNELLTTEPETSAAWYANIFDFEVEFVKDAKRYVLSKGDEKVASVSKNPFEDERNQWIPVLSVQDLDALVEKVAAKGGNIILPPTKDFSSGQIALILDPGGAPLALQMKGEVR